jgi:phosphoserine phosphatase RsbU/P
MPKNFKFRFLLPFKFKIAATQITTFLIFFGVFFYFTIDLFVSDKKAYIYESIYLAASQDKNTINQLVRSTEQKTQLLLRNISLLSYKEISEQGDLVFTSFRNAIDVSVYSTDDSKIRLLWYQFNNTFDKKNPNEKDFLTKKNKTYKEDALSIIESNTHFTVKTKIIKEEDITPHLLVMNYDTEKKILLVLRMSLDVLVSDLFSASSFHKYVVENQSAHIVLHNTNGEKSDLFQNNAEEFLKQIINDKVDSGVKEFTHKNGSISLLSFQKIKEMGITILNEVDKDAVFIVTKMLIIRTVFFSIAVVCFIVIISLILARILTKPIKTLLASTQIVAEGKFDQKVIIKSKDEVEVLAESFNLMIDRIRSMIEQLKEKTRLENEIAIAKLVQESFFPETEKEYPRIFVSGLYQTASECGGDWWGHYRVHNLNFIFIGDATGHGVPAALATATASCAASIYTQMARDHVDFAGNPQNFLALINEAIRKLGGKILMTMSILVFDEDTGECTYSSASHTQPILLRQNQEIEFLDQVNGPILGQEPQARYTSGKVTLKPGDQVLMYTDGIVEAKNLKERMYGDKKLIKSFIKNREHGTTPMLQKILDDAYEYYQGVIPDDDISLIVLRVKDHEANH